MKPIRKLLILARVTHYRHHGRFYAYAPYAREIEMWADLFPEVMIAGTCCAAAPPGDCAAFVHENITMCPVTEAGGPGLRAKFAQLLLLPRIVAQVLRYLSQADAVHVRCPCDLGLLGLIFAPLFSRYLIAKYATQWMPFPGEPPTWRFQRLLARSQWWRGPVTVYGHWPNQPAKVIPFFSSALTEAQLAHAREAATRPRVPGSLRVLFVGRLSRSKNVDVLLRAVAAAKTPNTSIACTIVGEGPERHDLETLARSLGVQSRVTFTGGLALEKVLSHYERSDLLVLASDIEGWPKAIAEGMAFGLVCVGSARGLMPEMLAEGRGFIVPPRNVEQLRAALEQAAADAEVTARMAQAAATWAQRFSLENLREELRQLMARHWGERFTPVPRPQPLGLAQRAPG